MAEPKTRSNGSKTRAQEPPTPAAEAEATGQHAEHVCPVAFCPIGAALSVVNGLTPDTLDHLLSAAREFFLAARAVVDTRAGDFEEDHARSTTLEKIEIG